MNTKESQITDYFARAVELNNADFPIGIGDDMAQMTFGGSDTALITTDMLLDGSHFDSRIHSLEQIGYKSMAASLSDCAAMATKPFAAVAAVALPKDFGAEKLKQLHKGIVKAGEMFGCKLIGGDITSWKDSGGKLAVNITMLSKIADNPPIRRTTAKVGDIICVTGTLGGSIKGKHLCFTPRVKEALEIAKIALPNSMMDISDGLSTDLNHIARLSAVGAVIDEELIPVSADAKAADCPFSAAINDGEDFELLFTISPQNYDLLKNNWQMNTPITAIGRIIEKGVYMNRKDGTKQLLLPSGFDHFRG